MAAFAARLRGAGLAVGPGESADALAALAVIDALDAEQAHTALRACLVKREADRAIFEQVFQAFFFGEALEPQVAVEVTDDDAEHDDAQAATGAIVQRGGPSVADAPAPDGRAEARGAAARGQLRQADMAGLDAKTRAQVLLLARRAGRRLARARSRRRSVPGRQGIDWPATLRAAVRHGGEPVRLVRRGRPRRRTRLFVFVDVSRSMQDYAALALAFVDGLARAFRSVDIVRFAERIEPGRERAARHGSGTRIGDSLSEALAAPAGRRVGRDTVALVVSDGWDAGDARRREAALAELARRAHALHWLDPLMGHPGYFASAAGPQHESTCITRIWPARHLAGLEQAVAALLPGD